MPKKIFDILPPDRKKKEVLKETPVLIKKTIKNPDLIKEIASQIEEKKVESKPEKKSRVPLKKLFKGFLIACLLVLVVGFAALILNSALSLPAKIKIWPKIESINISKDLSAGINQKEIDYENAVLPGQIVKGSNSKSQDFISSGKKTKEEKAKGAIHVYNSFSDAPQSLVSGTRFVSTDGKLFKTTAKATIPGGTYKGGKLVAGEADVNVEAAEVGESYNIGPTTFSIPGFAGTPKYTAFYGKSFSAMSGGAKKEVSIVTQDDLDKAEASLLEQVKKEGADLLKANVSSDLIFVDGSATEAVKEKIFSSKAGDEAEKFSLKLSIESKGVAFKKADIGLFTDNLLSKSISKEDKIKDNSTQIGYAFKSLNYSDKDLSGAGFKADISAKHYRQLDLEKIKEALLGKSFDQVKTLLTDDSLKISKIEINPGIFWRKSMPKSKEKVDIELKLDN